MVHDTLTDDEKTLASTRPFYGNTDLRVLDEQTGEDEGPQAETTETEPGELGQIVVKLPLPPGAFSTLWEHDEFFKELYFSRFPAILEHPALADCAVVGLEDSLKGHVPLGLCVLKTGVTKPEDVVLEEVVAMVRKTVGPVAAFKKAVAVKRLPKTRSGKIARSSIAKMINGKPYKYNSRSGRSFMLGDLICPNTNVIPATVEDVGVFPEIQETLIQKGLMSA
ncbi:Acyl-CoA synthetase short-chain member 3, mitochondrial [Branchiostoma belcheri]|nr:Acyl-CoA synthetase short-chain member 3, mitochondrial [Branchiostoma belcheri]